MRHSQELTGRYRMFLLALEKYKMERRNKPDSPNLISPRRTLCLLNHQQVPMPQCLLPAILQPYLKREKLMILSLYHPHHPAINFSSMLQTFFRPNVPSAVYDNSGYASILFFAFSTVFNKLHELANTLLLNRVCIR